jgi:hypothetical protein
MADKFGFKTNQKKTSKWGAQGGISGGNNTYNQIQLNQKFDIPKKPDKNIITDKPYDAHI